MNWDDVEELFGLLVNKAIGTIAMPLDSGTRFYWGFLLSSVILAVFVYMRLSKGKPGPLEKSYPGPFGFFHFLSPREIYLYTSSIVDYKIFIANRFVVPALLRIARNPIAHIFSVSALSLFVSDRLVGLFGTMDLDLGIWTLTVFTLTFALATDLATFANHALHHKIPLLWPLHSVHHSAEVLNVFTLFRKHPLYDVVKFFIKVPLVGFIQGIVIYCVLGEPEFILIFGVNMVYAAFGFMGGVLRHSHIWLSFGPVLEHIFISPAQHQIHHSARQEHRDRNFGEVFAIWDWMFGTLIIANEDLRKDIIVGIDVDVEQPHPSLSAAYIKPLKDFRRVCGDLFRRSASVG